MATAPFVSRAFGQRRRWRDFLDFAERHGSPHWLFRGVADSGNHLLIPKIGRLPHRYDPGTERILFRNFRRRARQFADGTLTDWDMLALGQHHGLPTRLLDWSTNPLVAAFFAVSSEPRLRTARVYAYQATRIVDPSVDKDPFGIDEIVTHIPSAITPRIISQRGVFTVHPDPTSPLMPTGGIGGGHVFDIDAGDRPYFERRLFGLAIDPSVIGADLDGLCRALNWQYERGVALGKVVF